MFRYRESGLKSIMAEKKHKGGFIVFCFLHSKPGIMSRFLALSLLRFDRGEKHSVYTVMLIKKQHPQMNVSVEKYNMFFISLSIEVCDELRSKALYRV